jgi:hypothetical protein
MKLGGRRTAALLLVLLAGTLKSAAEEPSQVRVYACVEREDAYLARTGITDPLGIDNPTTGGLVLASARPVPSTPSAPAEVAGDYLVSGTFSEAQLASALGTQIEVVGFIRSLTLRYAANGTTLPRRLTVTEWHPAGSCPAHP